MLTDLATPCHSGVSAAVCRHAHNASSDSAGSQTDQQVSHPPFHTETAWWPLPHQFSLWALQEDRNLSSLKKNSWKISLEYWERLIQLSTLWNLLSSLSSKGATDCWLLRKAGHIQVSGARQYKQDNCCYEASLPKEQGPDLWKKVKTTLFKRNILRLVQN